GSVPAVLSHDCAIGEQQHRIHVSRGAIDKRGPCSDRFGFERQQGQCRERECRPGRQPLRYWDWVLSRHKILSVKRYYQRGIYWSVTKTRTLPRPSLSPVIALPKIAP